jgi:DnaK suppressor protein
MSLKTRAATNKLLARQRELIIRRQALERAISEMSELREGDAVDIATCEVSTRLLETLDDRDLMELFEIADALSRIETGHFGRCAVCGEPIPEDRILALQTVVTCFGCAFREELAR